MRVRVNGNDVVLAGGATVDDLLRQLGLGGQWVLVERNGEPVPRENMASTTLTPDDRIELVRAVAGG